MTTDILNVRGKTVLITGGTSGIGKAVAEHFVKCGARVAILARRDGAALAREIGATFHRCDIAVDEEVASAFEAVKAQLGPLDVLVLNAGVDNTGPLIADQPVAELRKLLAINVEGLYSCLFHGQKVIKDGGSIIITSSAASLLTFPTYAQYSASKAAGDSLMRTAALELAPRRVRVNSVCPGGVNTAMMNPDHPEFEMIRKLTPLGRIAETSDLIGIYQFLASDASSYVSGQTVAVDGAATAGLGFGILQALH
jgi:NAD(P)-dependent dehydrogenase (short-subunit alcohol dehydrogenase family)